MACCQQEVECAQSCRDRREAPHNDQVQTSPDLIRRHGSLRARLFQQRSGGFDVLGIGHGVANSSLKLVRND